ncbi:MAG: hypothetical protein Q7K42_03395, partial [Candidatus Diapherotrites archaeon]|nr:hypothetical protein [Candidatus Diapherotrites archaeon]
MFSEFDESQIKLFWDYLDYSEVHARFKNPKTNDAQNKFANSLEEVITLCKHYNSLGYNDYAGLNPRVFHGTKSEHILGIEWLPIDSDSKRASGFEGQPANQSELNEAWNKTKKIIEFIREKFEAVPALTICTGNGFLLLYHIQLGIEHEGRIKAFLKNGIVENKFGELDPVGSLAQVIRIPEMINWKGQESLERQHRQVKIIYLSGKKRAIKLEEFIKQLTPVKSLPKP